jgi:predicted dehydrogenase
VLVSGFETIMTPNDLSSGRPARVGFVGAGGIAPGHAEALRLLGDVELVAVCDLQASRAKSLASDYGFRAIYGSLPEMLSQEKLDVVHILTQPQHHVDPAVECLRANCHVYVEKPLGLTTRDCRRLVEESASTRLSVGVNHQLVYDPAITGIVDLLRSCRLGRLNHIWLTFTLSPTDLPVSDMNHFMFAAPGNLVFEYGPHPFSLIRKFVGKPHAVTALASDPASLPNGKTYYRSWQVSTVSELGTAQLSLSLGRGNREITLWAFGQDGCALTDLQRGTLQVHENSAFPLTANFRDVLTNARRTVKQATSRIVDQNLVKTKLKHGKAINAFYPAFRAFYDCLRAGRPVPEDAQAGYDVIDYCERTVGNATMVAE